VNINTFKLRKLIEIMTNKYYQTENSVEYKSAIQGKFLSAVAMRSEEALSSKPLYAEGRGWWPLPQRRTIKTIEDK
jgi:hypothetical protein